MSIKRSKHKRIADPRLRELILRIEDFLDVHYSFRTKPEYKGFFGGLRARTDISRAEEADFLNSQAHIKERGFFGSGPEIYRQMVRQFEKEYAQDNFSRLLFEYMNAKGLDPVDVYKRARIDRRLFSKIRSDIYYLPGKRTILAFAIAMELNLEETRKLLSKAGYALSNQILFDTIVRFFIENGEYNMDEINMALHEFGQSVF